MKNSRFPRFLGLPVLAVCGFVVAGLFASVGLTGITTTTDTTTDTVTTTDTTTTTPEGGDGCTPGYWKQSQHFDSYPAGITPSTLLSAVGINSSVSFLTALSTTGGGLNALLRHGAAAYLNAASTGVDYDLTTAEVVELVNDAIASGDYESAKDVLEGFNEQGCPLN
jgi:hypothetical protein